MDREAAIEVLRSYLADLIEIEAIPKEECEKLTLYTSNDRHHYYWFYVRYPTDISHIGSTLCAAIAKESGRIAYLSMVGE